MKQIFLLLMGFFSYLICAQITVDNKFDLGKFNETKSNVIEFKKNDSTIIMNYNKNGISTINVCKGNFEILYLFHPNLNLKTKRQSIFGKMHLSEYFVGIEKNYSEDGKLIQIFDWNKAPINDNSPPPKYSIWNIAELMRKEFDIDIINDERLYYIFLEINEKNKIPIYKIGILQNEKYYILYEFDANNGNLILQKKMKII